MPRPATFDHLRKQGRTEQKVTLCFDQDAVEALESAESDEERTKAQAAIEKASVAFTFRSLGRKAWNDLVAKHPPTDTQVAEAEVEGIGKPAYNADTFPAAAIASCLVDPQLSEDEVAELLDEWNESDGVQLFLAAWGANTQSRVVQQGKGSGVTTSSG